MNDKIACESVEPLLTAYLLGELPADKAAFVRKHLESCSTCRASAQDFASTLDLLRGALAVGPEATARLTPERRARIQAARPTAARLWFDRALPILARAALWLLVPAVLIGLMLPSLSSSRKHARSQMRLAMEQEDASVALYDAPAPTSVAAVESTPPGGDKGRASALDGWSDDSADSEPSHGLDLKKRESQEHALANGERRLAVGRGAASDRESGGKAGAFTRGEDLVPLQLELPKPKFVGTPLPAPTIPARPAVVPVEPPSPPPPAVAPGNRGPVTTTYSLQSATTSSRTDRVAQAVDAPAQEKAPVVGDIPLTGRLFGSATASGGAVSQPAAKVAARPSAPAKSQTAVSGLKADYDERAKEVLAKDALREGRAVQDVTAMPEEKPADAYAGVASQETLERTRANKPAEGKDVNGPVAVAGGEAAAGLVVDALTVAGQTMATDYKEEQEVNSEISVEPGARLEDTRKEKEDPAPPAEPVEPAVFHAYEETAQNAFSTFGIDVDTASFTRARRSILQGRRPEPESVRTEEFVNAFDYAYSPPATGTFAIYAEAAPSPFRRSMDTLKIGIRGKVLGRDRQRASVLTLVVDTSGSMEKADRIGLIRNTLRLLVEQLGPEDSVALVQFSNRANLLFDHARPFDKTAALAAIDRMQVAGSTQLAEGIKLGYEVAARAYRPGASNRVLLLSDGVANLGEHRAEPILQAVEGYRRQGLYLSVFGFGSGTYNDRLLETLADKGDGAYAFIDSAEEAKRLLVDQLDATLHVIAADVKIQVEFNPKRVKLWRQLGYENRKLTKEQFRDDAVDAGEVGSGQSVTALYDIELHGSPAEPIGTVRLRYRDPETGRVDEVARPLVDADRGRDFAAMPAAFQLAACVAEYAELLRLSPYTTSAGQDFREVEKALTAVAAHWPLDARVQEVRRMAQVTQGLPW